MDCRCSFLFSTIVAVLILSGCVPLKAYHATEDEVAQVNGEVPVSKQPSLSMINENNIDTDGANTCPDAYSNGNDSLDMPKTCMAVVEFDDFGRLFNRSQLKKTLETAEQIAKGPQSKNQRTGGTENVKGGVIVVYVHGWKHNAGNNKGNDFAKFKTTIKELGSLKPDRVENDRRIMGIYLGWRGDSVSVPYIKNLSFWDRKITAHAVGNGGVVELLKHLTMIRDEYPTSRLVIVGHSFGAAVVYSAMEHQILSEIIESPSALNKYSSVAYLKKRWDMVMLINPAFEAMQVRSQYSAARSREYMIGQLPHVVFITSESDWATNYAFPAGRSFSTIFKKYSKTDVVGEQMNVTAIGHYIPYVTHQLVAQAQCPSTEPGDAAAFPSGSTGGAMRPVNANDTLRNIMQSFYSKEKGYCFGELVKADSTVALSNVEEPSKTSKDISMKVTVLTQCDDESKCSKVAPGHFIKRGTLRVNHKDVDPAPVPHYMPIMNIRATNDVMNGHNDIWNPVMRNFMVQFLLHTVTDTLDGFSDDLVPVKASR